MPMKKVDPIKIAEEMAQQGRIPNEYKGEFAEALDREVRREVRRLASDMAIATAGAMRVGRLLAA